MGEFVRPTAARIRHLYSLPCISAVTAAVGRANVVGLVGVRGCKPGNLYVKVF